MQRISALRKAIWSAVPFLEGKQDLPMGTLVTLLFIMERGETSSPEIQEALGIKQATTSRAISSLKLLGLVDTYPGADSRGRPLNRVMVSPSEKGKALQGRLKTIILKELGDETS